VHSRDRLTVLLLASAGSVHTARWAAELGAAGHDVVVASWRPGPQLPGADLRVAPAVSARPLWRLPLAAMWLRRLVRAVQPDVVHVHSLGTYALLSLALPRNPARVLSPYGSELRSARRSAIRATVIRLALRRADVVLPCSAEVAAEVTGRYAVPAERAPILSWGVSADLIAARPSISARAVRSEFGIPADATVVLSIRSTAATYRVLQVVEAFAQAAADQPGLFLVLLGGARPERESGRRSQQAYLDGARAATRHIRDRVMILGPALSRERTFELMCASDAAVSIPAADHHSYSVLEAALAGCRLLLADIAPYREMTGDGMVAELLPEPIVSELARRLRLAATEPRDRDVNQGFILTREHGAGKLAEHVQIYRRLTAARTAR
jgi:glycosyltransferase involved in cell wall biosynthesis